MIVTFLAAVIMAPRVARLHTGFQFTEGPAVDSAGNLYFTDVPARRIYRRTFTGKLTLLTRRSGGCVGLEMRQGVLVGAQSGAGRVVSLRPPGWALSSIASGLGTPNDLVSDGRGGLYVTSPDFQNRKADAIYFVPPSGRAQIVDRSVKNPNGIALSADGRTLYVVGYGSHDVRSFPILTPGRLGPGRRLMKLAGPGGKAANTGGDGMAVGPDGRMYIAVPEARGIHVAEPTGQFRAFYPLPEKPSNCVLSPNGRILYVTAQKSVFKIEL